MNGDHHSREPRILWGRVAFYGLTLLVAFALGSWSAADDTAEAELDDAHAEIERLARQNTNLRAEKDALEAGGVLDAEEASATEDGDDADESGESGPDGGDTAAQEAAPDDASADDADGEEPPPEDGDADLREADADDATEAGEVADADPASGTYVVREGDTGRSIAEAVYGDSELWPRIAEANDLGGDNMLQVDQELVIPPSE